MQFYFSWDTKNYSEGIHTLTVQLFKSGCPSASDSRNVFIVILHHIKIFPSSVAIYCGQSINFTVTGYDQYGNIFPLDSSKVFWGSNCGTMIPSNGSTSSTLLAGATPKQNGLVEVYYPNDSIIYSDIASVRVYPKVGQTLIDGERYNPFGYHGIFRYYYYIHLWIVSVKDSYLQEWGTSPDYPTLYYVYWVCGGNLSSHRIQTTRYIFPNPYERYDGNIWECKVIETLYKFDNSEEWASSGPESNSVWFIEYPPLP